MLPYDHLLAIRLCRYLSVLVAWDPRDIDRSVNIWI